MREFSKIRSEHFLESLGFFVVKRKICKRESKLKDSISFVGGFPVVMKSKNKINSNVETYSEALHFFKRNKKGLLEGVLIQEKLIEGKKFKLKIKETPEFGSVIFLSSNKKEVSIKSLPIDKKEIKKMVAELKLKTSKPLLSFLEKLSSEMKKFKGIKELSIDFFLYPSSVKIFDSKLILN